MNVILVVLTATCLILLENITSATTGKLYCMVVLLEFHYTSYFSIFLYKSALVAVVKM